MDFSKNDVIDELEALGIIVTTKDNAATKDRTKSIGGSLATVIMGVDEYGCIIDAYKNQLYGAPEISGYHLDRGVFMEPHVLKWLQENVDPTITESPTLQHPDYPFITGTPDAIGRTGIYEIKCPTMKNVEEILSQGIKTNYYWQCQHYQLLTTLPTTVVVWDYDHHTAHLFPVEKNIEGQQEMLRRYLDYWEAKSSGKELKPWSVDEIEQFETIYDDELDDILRMYCENSEIESNAKEAKRLVRAQITSRLMPNTGRKTLLTKNYMAKWVDKGSYGYVMVRPRPHADKPAYLDTEEKV